jgi:hypothetical protein
VTFCHANSDNILFRKGDSMKGEELLGKVDSGKRDFLRKLAIGSAYAVPLMTTVSLDGAIRKARAQAVYGPPQVIRFRAVAAPPNNNFAVPPQGQPTSPPVIGYWSILYDRPMDPNYQEAKAWSFPQPNHVACPDFTPKECFGDTGPGGFAWFNGNTEERHPIDCEDRPVLIVLKLNPPQCANGIFYRDTEGNILTPFHGCADSFDLFAGCPR